MVESAPAPQSQKPIDFLLDLNQDVLEKEVPASVKPISLAQVGTTTEKNSREPAPVFEGQADVQEIPREPSPTASQLNTSRDEVEDQDFKDNDDRLDSEDESEQQEQQLISKDNEEDNKEDTTIRVYGDEDENDENDKSLQQNEQKDQNRDSDQKEEPEVQQQPQKKFEQPKEEISQHADTVKQLDETVNQSGVDLFQELDQETIPEVIAQQSDSLDNQQEIEVQPDQLFNHGSIVIDKSTFADEDLPSTTPFSNKKWNHDHGPPGFGPWHKFPGFSGHKHEDGRPPFPGMPPFDGPPPQFDGPPHWHHFHNHSHDHGDWHHDHDHGFHGGHVFHRRGPWKWDRS